MAWDKPNAARDRIFGVPPREGPLLTPLSFSLPALRAAAGDMAFAALFLIVWIAADQLPMFLVSGVTLSFQLEIIALLATLAAGAASLAVGLGIEAARGPGSARAGTGLAWLALRIALTAAALYLFLAWLMRDAPSSAGGGVFIITLLLVALNRAWRLMDQPGPTLIYLAMYVIMAAVVHPILSRMFLPPLGLTQEITVALVNSSFTHPWALEEYLLMPGGYMLTAALFYAGAALLTVMMHGASAAMARKMAGFSFVLIACVWDIAGNAVRMARGEVWLWMETGGAILILIVSLAVFWGEANTPERKRTAVALLFFLAMAAVAAALSA
ncbi:MAG: hypothetical protein HY804_10180 [Nitrospinae bacterium]|nr:hypothetical protein [Nitrospinota bacterium]